MCALCPTRSWGVAMVLGCLVTSHQHAPGWVLIRTGNSCACRAIRETGMTESSSQRASQGPSQGLKPLD